MSKEKKDNQKSSKNNPFEEAFQELLNPKEPLEIKENSLIQMPEEESAEESLDEILDFGPNEEMPPMEYNDWVDASKNYIPETTGDEKWEEYVSQPPIPPLTPDQEARAVSLGLQELRKQKDYTQYLYRHMSKEFHSIYVTFPILIQRFFDEVYGKTHEGIASYIEDMEYLIAGNIKKIKAVNDDFRLYQRFEEHRLNILYAILEFYNKKG